MLRLRSLWLFSVLSLISLASPTWALPTFRAPLDVVLFGDTDRSGTITCGDVLRYTLTLEPQTEFGTDLQDVVFDIVPDTNILFDPASVVAVNSDQAVQVVLADPLGIRVEFGRVCNSASCPKPPLRLTFEGRIRVLNTGTAVSIQGRVLGSNINETFTDGTPNAAIEPTVSPYPACPPTVSLRAPKTWSLVDDRDRDVRPDPGDSIRYSIDVQNTSGGGVGASGVFFDSDVDRNATLLAGSVTTTRGTVQQGNAFGDSHVRVNVGNLAASATARITFDARINSPFPTEIKGIACQGTITSSSNAFPPFPTDDPSTPALNDPTRTGVDFDPDLSIEKTDGGALAVPGRTVVYTLTARNLSPREVATGTILSETLASLGTLDVARSSKGWTCTAGNCTLTLGTLAPLAVETRTFAVLVSSALPAGTRELTNTARISDDGAQGPDPNLGNNAASESTPLDLTVARPDLAIEKTDDGATIRPSEIVHYRLTYRNLGPLGATGVTLTETVPPHSIFIAREATNGWSCPDASPPGTTCTLTIRGLPAAASGQAIFAVRANATFPASTNQLSNTATVTDDGANGTDANLANNSATDSTPITGLAPDLTIEKTYTRESDPTPGGILVFRITYSNRGNQDAVAVAITDTLPQHTTFQSLRSTPGWICRQGANTENLCTISIGNLAAGASGEVRIALQVAKPLAAGVDLVRNCATINSLSSDTARLAAESCSEARLDAAPDLHLAKTDGGVTARSSAVVAYTLQAENRGNQHATSVTITETVPTHTTFEAAASSPNWTCTPNQGAGSRCTYTLGQFPVGNEARVVFAVRVDRTVPANVTQLTNTASITDDQTNGPDPNPDDNLAMDQTPLEGAPPTQTPKLTATKRDALTRDLGTLGSADPGDRITYTVVITNEQLENGTTASDVIFRSGVDPNSTLQAGTVTTTRGTITLGNRANDRTLEVRLGNLALGESATITFTVQLNAQLPQNLQEITCQGDLLSGNAPPTVTNDPDTPEPLDPTRTRVRSLGPPEPAEIPTLGDLGMAMLIALLLAVALPRLSRTNSQAQEVTP